MKARIDGFWTRIAASPYLIIVIILIVFSGSLPGKAQQPGATSGSGGIPGMFSYQGVIKVNAQPYTGSGYFKFAIVAAASGDGPTNYWANDGTSSGEPGEYVSLGVSNGLFEVYLGDTGSMSQSLDSAVFTNDPTYLRVWFSGSAGGPYEALEPNQRIVSAPYAMNAARLDGQEGAYYLDAGNIISGTLDTSHFSAYSDLQAEGKIGLGSEQLASGIHSHYGDTWSGNNATHGLVVIDSKTTEPHDAIYGESNTDQGAGVVGKATLSTGKTFGVEGESQATLGRGVYGYASQTSGENFGVFGETASSNGVGVYGEGPYHGINGKATETDVNSYGVYGESFGSSGAAVVATNHYTGAGIASYAWIGNIIEGYAGEYQIGIPELTFKVENDGDVYTDRAYHCGLGSGSSSEPGACVIQNSPADFAEMFPASLGLEAGDVLVINQDGLLERSERPNQPNVVGVYSSRPGYLGGGEYADEEGYAPLAIAGLVMVKASNENGEIQPGDLLVASGTPGHAMKAGAEPAVGSVIGKAMQTLGGDAGVILMLVMLQ